MGRLMFSVLFLTSVSLFAQPQVDVAGDGYIGGSLGIGQNTPTHKLHVLGENPVVFIQPSTWSSGRYAELRLGDQNHFIRGRHTNGMRFHDVDKFEFTGGTVNVHTRLRIGGNTDGGSWTTGISGNLIQRTGDTALAVEESDHVGIGTFDFTNKLHVEGSTSSTASVIFSETNYTGTSGVTAISGIAGTGSGNKKGINGSAAGNGTLYGVYGYASGFTLSETSFNAYGVYGMADSGRLDKFGVYGTADHNSGTKYGIYGNASGSGTNYAGYFNGDVTVTGTFNNPSDLKFKRNIIALEESTLYKLLQLQPVTYEFKKEAFSHMNLPEGEHIGFVAQDVEKIFPKLVKDEKHPSYENPSNPSEKPIKGFDYKSINYIQLIPLLTKAIQEQQIIIETQKNNLEVLVEKSLKIDKLEKTVKYQQQQIDHLNSLIENIIQIFAEDTKR